jgi:dienelactone hydrolase
LSRALCAAIFCAGVVLAASPGAAQNEEHNHAHEKHERGAWGVFHGERLEFQAEDGAKLVGYYEAARNTTFTVVMVPMLGNPMASYFDFTEHLHEFGIGTFVFDHRGNGESTGTVSGGELDWRKFTDVDYAKFPGDIVAGVTALKQHDVPTSSVYLMGAGIGANAVIVAAAQLPEVTSLYLLSPGLDIHGLKALDAVRAISGKTIFIVNGSHDEYAVEARLPIAEAAKAAGNFPRTGDFKRTEMFNLHGSALMANRRAAGWLINTWLPKQEK